MTLIFLDTETTGVSGKSRLCEVAYNYNEEWNSEYFKPPIPVSIEAMAVNHITNESLKDKPIFINSPFYNKLKPLLEDKQNILVAHNSPFDVEILRREGINTVNQICTQKMTHFANNDIPQYHMQYLRYYFHLEVNTENNAHSALGDIEVLKKLFNHLYNTYYKNINKSKEQILYELINITKKPSLLNRIRFGKHKGQTFEYIFEHDFGYLRWLANQPKLDENLGYTLNYWISKNNF